MAGLTCCARSTAHTAVGGDTSACTAQQQGRHGATSKAEMDKHGQAAARRHSVPPTLPIRSPSTTTTRLQCSARQRQRRHLQQPLLGLGADALQVLRCRLLLRGTLALHGRTIRLILSRPPRPCRARLLQRAGGGAAGQAACTCAAASCSQGGRRLPAGRPPRLPVQAPLQRQGRNGHS